MTRLEGELNKNRGRTFTPVTFLLSPLVLFPGLSVWMMRERRSALMRGLDKQVYNGV